MIPRRVPTALGVAFLLVLALNPAAQAAAPSAPTVEEAYQRIFEPAAPAPDVDPSAPQALATFVYCCSPSYCCNRITWEACAADGGNAHQFERSCELICHASSC